jgi:ABC-type nitrate/sulfonate/bicarbonate transport system substrate-binding protein
MYSLLLLIAVFFQLHYVDSLRIASSLLWIEHTPQPYAIKNFYNGSTPATLVSGSVADLASNRNFDLSANAETQGLKQYANHRNIRLIYVICEVPYRLIANKQKGIAKLADLKGKKIGTVKGSSAGVFVHNMMSSVGVQDREYEAVDGLYCMKAPCKNDALPSLLKSGSLDAYGIWETSIELGAMALGNDAIIFQNASIYREVYALYSTTEALSNPSKRRDIVEFVRALDKTLDIFSHQPKEKNVFDYVAKTVDTDTEVVEAVWKDHKWDVRWDDRLIDFLVEEDRYLAGQDNRKVTPRKDLEKFLDSSIVHEL